MYQTKADPSRLITSKEIADYFRVSRTTLYRWIKEKNFPAPVIATSSRTRFWDRAEVDAWVKAESQKTAARIKGRASSTPSDEAQASSSDED